MKPTFEEIKEAVLDTLNIKSSFFDNSSKSRTALMVKARQIICHICRKCGYTSAYIGEKLSLHYTSVLYHEKTSIDHCLYERDYSSIVNKILAKLNISIEETTLCGYITRDEDGQLTLFSEKPNRDRFIDGEGFWCGECPRELNPTLFPQITWTNEPKECKIVITLK